MLLSYINSEVRRRECADRGRETVMPIDLEKIRAFFSADRYATDVTGIRIVSAGGGEAVCTLDTNERDHSNAGGSVQGGAIFTLCDLCFAAAANAEDITQTAFAHTITVSAHISYLRSARVGETLTARAKRLKHGRSTCCYEVLVYGASSADKAIASAMIDGFTIEH